MRPLADRTDGFAVLLTRSQATLVGMDDTALIGPGLQKGIDMRRGARSAVQPLLLVGDIISFFTFAAVGRASHDEAGGWSALGGLAGTAAPFLVAWMLVGIPTGAMSCMTGMTLKRLVTKTALAWLLAWPVALLFRALLLRRGIPMSFAIVALVTNGSLLLGWRSLAYLVMLRMKGRV